MDKFLEAKIDGLALRVDATEKGHAEANEILQKDIIGLKKSEKKQ